LLVGGYAVGYYGYPRATGDMDVWVAIDPMNARKMIAVLTAFGFGEGVREEFFLAPNEVIRMGHPPLRLEILTSISGVDFSEAYRNRVIDTID
jgi:hypothetical protein